MKKNMMVIGMLVAWITIPMNIFAQELEVEQSVADSTSGVMVPVKEQKVREPRVQIIDSTHYSYGSVVSVHGGFGVSGLWAKEAGQVKLQNEWGFPGFTIGVRYSYFWYSWLGFTTGLDYSSYRSKITMKGVMSWPENGKMTNAEGMEYVHRLNFSGEGAAQSTWEETEDVGMIEIPIALSFKYKPNKIGLLSTVGLKLGFPVKGRYRYQGTLNHSGYYSSLDYLEHNDQYFLANDSYDETYKDYKKGTLSVVNAELFGEIGALFQVHERVDLSLSVFGSYGMNDLNATTYDKRDVLGFRTAEQASRAPKMDVTCMNNYHGLVGTQAIDHINSWNLGVKIGVHFYCADENDAERAARLAAQNKAPEPMIIYVRDTIQTERIVRDTIRTERIVHDTISQVIRDTVKVIDKAAQEVEKLAARSIIYFHVGDYQNPMVEPSYMLDSISAILVRYPELKVSVEGHASKDGNAAKNKTLALNRAKAVAEELQTKGVRESQIMVRSYGSDQPYHYGNTTADDPNKDRRVEIIPVKQ